MENSNNVYTKTFTWEIDNFLSLRQANKESEHSDTFKWNLLGQEIQCVLRVYPRGFKENAKNNVSIFLLLFYKNESKKLNADWKLTIINAKGNKVNKHEGKLFEIENYVDDINISICDFDNFISRANLADPNKNYIVDGHKLILHSEITIKKDLQAELMHEKEKSKSLKRKLDEKEAEIEKMRSDNEQCQKRHRTKIEKLEKNKSDALEKYQKEEKSKSNLRTLYQCFAKHSEKLEKEKSEVEKNLEKLKGKYDKLSNFMRDSSKLMEEIENDDEFHESSTSSA